MSKRMYHPCHKLSVPSAKIFWCRHCMQMFEDAISRWKHSKLCRGSSGVKHKDQDGQVIQMYVKPDKVSYTSNLVPGQPIIHKPHVKKTSADLKCVICQTKFYSLYDMREHVKFPCQRVYNSAPSESDDSDSEDIPNTPTSIKIRRVESTEIVNSSTALAVLAEASKHVESLSYGHSLLHPLQQIVTEEVIPSVAEYVTQSASGDISVSVPQTYQEYTEVEVVGGTLQQTRSIPSQSVEVDPVVIVIQSEDGQDIPETSLDIDTIQNCVRETVLNLPVGQIIQVQININDKKVRHYNVGPEGTIYPLEQCNPITLTLPGASQQQHQLPSLTNHSNTPGVSDISTGQYQLQGSSHTQGSGYHHTTSTQPQQRGRSVLAEVLSSSALTSQEIANHVAAQSIVSIANHVAAQSTGNSFYTGSDVVVEEGVYPVQDNGNHSSYTGQIHGNTVEHSYQNTNTVNLAKSRPIVEQNGGITQTSDSYIYSVEIPAPTFKKEIKTSVGTQQNGFQTTDNQAQSHFHSVNQTAHVPVNNFQINRVHPVSLVKQVEPRNSEVVTAIEVIETVRGDNQHQGSTVAVGDNQDT